MKRSLQSAAALSSTVAVSAFFAMDPSARNNNNSTTTEDFATATNSTSGSSSLSPDGVKSERRAGRILFQSCQSCHVGAPFAPPFWREEKCILGQQAGTLYADYPYSFALKQSGVIWTEEALDAFLEDPQGFLPNNVMQNLPMSDPVERKIAIDMLKKFCDDAIATVVPPLGGPTVPPGPEMEDFTPGRLDGEGDAATTPILVSPFSLWVMAPVALTSWLLLGAGRR